MTDPSPSYSGSDGDSGHDAGTGLRGRPFDEGTPRWVKVFGIVAIALVVLFIIVHLSGGGFGRHMP